MTQRSKYKSKQAQMYLNYKDNVGWTFRGAGVHEPTLKPVEVYAKAFIHVGGKDRDMDVDNLGKCFLDSLNKIVYNDDKQVMKLNIEKFYVEKSQQRAEIEIKEIS